MLSRVAFLAAVAMSAAVASAAENDVLYWMVDDSATIDGTDVREFMNDYDAPSDSYFAARVRVTGGNITEDTFLNLYSFNEDNSVSVEPGNLGVDFFDNGAGYWGAGVPDGNKSPSGDYSAGTPEYSFIVEIGNVVGVGSDHSSWTTIASTEPTGYSELAEFIQQTQNLGEPLSKIWIPTEFVTPVPEPSGGLLLLVGAAVLALRRRREA
ncbi:MAG: PEP-CTERM sorting domain-containing protein [Kiritimatiellae bacterium]|nr:PEP-CTERM sorting domain-containing protein [Kiritimatiellia bacterium]